MAPRLDVVVMCSCNCYETVGFRGTRCRYPVAWSGQFFLSAPGITIAVDLLKRSSITMPTARIKLAGNLPRPGHRARHRNQQAFAFYPAAMLQRGIKRQNTSEDLNALTSLDLIETDLAIAMCETEHRPMMIEKYPLWVDYVIYWRVHDLPDSQPSEAIPEIERQVFLLLAGISASNPIDTPVAVVV